MHAQRGRLAAGRRVGRDRIDDLWALNEADVRGKADAVEDADLAPLQALSDWLAQEAAAARVSAT